MQNLLDRRFYSFGEFTLDLIYCSGLGIPFVFQSPREFYAYLPEQILVCAYTIFHKYTFPTQPCLVL